MSKSTSFFVSGLLVGILLATVGFSMLRQYQISAGDPNADARVVLKLGHVLDVGHPVHKATESDVRLHEPVERLEVAFQSGFQ